MINQQFVIISMNELQNKHILRSKTMFRGEMKHPLLFCLLSSVGLFKQFFLLFIIERKGCCVRRINIDESDTETENLLHELHRYFQHFVFFVALMKFTFKLEMDDFSCAPFYLPNCPI